MTVLILALAVAGGVLYLTARPIVAQSVDLANSAAEGIQRLQGWLTGPPLNLSSERLNSLTATAVDRLRSSAADIASGVFKGVSVVSGTVVTAVLVLVLAFFFVKDGPAFLPWLRRWTGPSIGAHLTEVLARAWQTLSNFIRVQALVSLVDAVLIGLGLVLLGVPLAPALAVLTFIAGFVPIVGAITAGALAVLVALVSNGFTTALLVLALIVVVQQLESNVLQPFLQGRSLNLHAAVVLLAVTAGGTLYGIIGAFLAVPVAAVTATVLRYISEQIALRSGEMQAADVSAKTAEGSSAAREGERAASRVLRRWRRDQREQA
jgi:predicted PurR-regulated permease PerM